jgi:hypothetical protein
MPLPTQKSPRSIFHEYQAARPTLDAALDALAGCDHYLLMGDEKEVLYSEVKSMVEKPKSQFFRQRLASTFDLQRPWDWRAATSREWELISALTAFGGHFAI